MRPGVFFVFTGIWLKKLCLLVADAAPVFSAAKTPDASFNPQGVGSHRRDAAFICFAVVGIIDVPGPFIVRSGRPHIAKESNADDRPIDQCGVWIVLVRLRLAGFRVDWIGERRDGSTIGGAAPADTNLGIAGLGQPQSAGIRGGLGENRLGAGQRSPA